MESTNPPNPFAAPNSDEASLDADQSAATDVHELPAIERYRCVSAYAKFAIVMIVLLLGCEGMSLVNQFNQRALESDRAAGKLDSQPRDILHWNDQQAFVVSGVVFLLIAFGAVIGCLVWVYKSYRNLEPSEQSNEGFRLCRRSCC